MWTKDTTRTKYTFKGRDRGRYVWSSDNGDVCCGIKYFWNPEKSPFRMSLTKVHRTNALAKALWDTPRDGNVFATATGVEKNLQEMGYTLLKRRNF